MTKRLRRLIAIIDQVERDSIVQRLNEHAEFLSIAGVGFDLKDRRRSVRRKHFARAPSQIYITRAAKMETEVELAQLTEIYISLIATMNAHTNRAFLWNLRIS